MTDDGHQIAVNRLCPEDAKAVLGDTLDEPARTSWVDDSGAGLYAIGNRPFCRPGLPIPLRVPTLSRVTTPSARADKPQNQ